MGDVSEELQFIKNYNSPIWMLQLSQSVYQTRWETKIKEAGFYHSTFLLFKVNYQSRHPDSEYSNTMSSDFLGRHFSESETDYFSSFVYFLFLSQIFWIVVISHDTAVGFGSDRKLWHSAAQSLDVTWISAAPLWL